MLGRDTGSDLPLVYRLPRYSKLHAEFCDAKSLDFIPKFVSHLYTFCCCLVYAIYTDRKGTPTFFLETVV